MIYVKEIRENLNKINECSNKWTTMDGEIIHCELDHLCEQCQSKFWDCLDWANMDDVPATTPEAEA